MFRALICQSHNFPHPGRIACCSTPNSRPPGTMALYTIRCNNTSIVSSSWWWAYECPKHVEQIIIAIKHSVASSWFSSLRLYYDARTNVYQIDTEMVRTAYKNFYTTCYAAKAEVWGCSLNEIFIVKDSHYIFWVNITENHNLIVTVSEILPYEIKTYICSVFCGPQTGRRAHIKSRAVVSFHFFHNLKNRSKWKKKSVNTRWINTGFI